MARSEVTFRRPSNADIEALALTMREADRKECEALHPDGVSGALRDSVNHAEWTLAAHVDGAVVCIFGMGLESFISEDGAPWMLSADGIEQHARAIMTHAPRYVARMRAGTAALRNLVHADNSQAIRFLRWLGFSFGDEIEINGEPFLRFEMANT